MDELCSVPTATSSPCRAPPAWWRRGSCGRISMATIGLGVVLLISGLTGSYGLAGAVASVEALAYAVASPRLARLVDRYGQSTVLLPRTLVLTVAVTMLTVAAMAGWPRWTLFVAAAVTGVSVPPLGSLVRARWNHLLGGTPRLHTAFMLFATIDITTVAFAEELGAKSAAGPLLAAYALGSCLSGVLYGARTWQWPLDRRFAVSLGLIALGAAPPVIVHSIPLMAVVVFLAGFAISPTAISGYALIRERVPASALTEGMAWVSTSVGVGLAVGSPIAGRIVDAYGAHAGYAFGLAAALFSAIVGLTDMLRPRPVPAPPPRTS
ncbi:MAG: MFS transporter [Streptosporangiales bacterium]|nr:MFS transporter [Streptosporangiales bacterium]